MVLAVARAHTKLRSKVCDRRTVGHLSLRFGRLGTGAATGRDL